jgi:GAF domain-containing protein
MTEDTTGRAAPDTDGPRPWADRGEVEEVTGALEALGAALDVGTEVDVLLQQVCQHVLVVVPGAEMVSVTLVRGGVAQSAVCTDDRALRIDAKQYEIGDGPCLEAAATGKIVRVATEAAHRRWPQFADSAGQAGVGSYLSAPLTVDAQHHGAINLFSTQSHGFGAVDGALLELYITAVETALRAAAHAHSVQQLTENLQQALVTRPVIEQAKGILMAARGVSEEEAFRLLVEQSQRENIKLHDVAARFVAQVLADHQP